MFVKAQKSRDSMPLPAPRGTESGFKLSSLSSQWPKARRAEGAGARRQAGGGTPRGRLCLVMLSVSVCLLALKAQRWTRARVCVCVPGGKDTRGWVRGGGKWGCCLSGINKCRNRQLGRLAALFQHRCLSYMHQIQLNSKRGQVRPTLLQPKCVWGLNRAPTYVCHICGYAKYVNYACVYSSIDDNYTINWAVKQRLCELHLAVLKL